jgi:predicted enzyme related to lactoylglutathione lyase
MAKIVHFEMPVDDADRAAGFYRDVLGWSVTGFGDQPYWLVQAGAADEPGADGALVRRDDLHRAPVLIAGVDDIDAALRRAADHGGRVVQGKLPIPGVGFSAYFVDSEGNLVGLFQPGESDVSDMPGATGR